MDVPGSRLLLRPAAGSAAVFPGMAVCQVRGTPMIRGWRLSSVRIQVLGGCGIRIVLAFSPHRCPFASWPAAADVIKVIMAGQRTGQPAYGRNSSCAALLAAGAPDARTGPRHER
jgi:hypothetical protein